MPLKITRRHGSPYWYLRGSVRGSRIDESTGTECEKAAKEIRITREAELLKRSIHGDAATRTFAEAAVGYLTGGGDGQFLNPILKRIGRKLLAQIDQALIEETAQKLYPDGGPATQNRKAFTPISAVLHYAARKGWCSKPVIARPKQPKGRVRFVNQDVARVMIDKAAPHLKPLVLFLFSTGCRLAEALYLDWSNVDLPNGEATFPKTKNGEARTVPLAPEVVAELANLPWKTGAVFRTQMKVAYEDRHGEGGGQIKTAFATMCKNAGVVDFSPHCCRHSFATWYLRQNPGDLIGLMKVGGWKSVKMVQVYAHINVDDVKPRVAGIWGNSGEQSKAAPTEPLQNKVVSLK